MAAQLYLITPANADAEGFATKLMSVLSAAEFSALLVARGELDSAAYAKLAASIVNIGQGAGCAVLVENDAALAKKIGADGVHITGDDKALREAVSQLKPAMIVGAGNLNSRHDAMTAGELDIDYVFFGPLAAPNDAKATELAEWWADTFEIPAVLSLPELPGDGIATAAEFVALSHAIWSSADPAATVRALAAKLDEVA